MVGIANLVVENKRKIMYYLFEKRKVFVKNGTKRSKFHALKYTQIVSVFSQKNLMLNNYTINDGP